MKKNKLNFIPFIILLALALLVDFFIRATGPKEIPSIFVIIITVQMLAFMKIEIKKNNQLKAFCIFVFSMLCMIAAFGEIYTKVGFYDANKNISHDLVGGIYLSIVTWTTLGYGDFSPTESTRILAGIESLVGYLYLGIFVAFIINHLSINSKARNLNDS